MNESEGLEELEEFVLEAKVLKDSRAGLMEHRQRAAGVSDAVGVDDFSGYGLGDAAVALTKVTGVSVTDGKYVVIRGLGDRYANTNLNGSTLPNPDPDQQTVRLDLFPTELLDTIVTAKTFTPDQPGNSSGGSVNMKTKSFPEDFVLKISAEIGYSENASIDHRFLEPADKQVSFLADDFETFASFEESNELFSRPADRGMVMDLRRGMRPCRKAFRLRSETLSSSAIDLWELSLDSCGTAATSYGHMRFDVVSPASTPGLGLIHFR